MMQQKNGDRTEFSNLPSIRFFVFLLASVVSRILHLHIANDETVLLDKRYVQIEHDLFLRAKWAEEALCFRTTF